MSSINSQDAITGAYAPPSGNHSELAIKGDGSYTDNGLLQTTLYNGTTSLFVMREGKFRTSGDSVMFTPSEVKTSMQNTCGKSSNYNNRDGEKNVRTYTFAVKTDDNGPLLELAADDGGVITYRPGKS